MKKLIITLMLFSLILTACENNIIHTSNKTGFKLIACGYWHCIALREDKTIWSWGANWYGQLGNGAITPSTIPIQIKNFPDVISIACGAAHNLALKKDGTVWAWGANFYGQLGNRTRDLRTTPIKINELSKIISISCGASHCIALKEDGTLWTWGYNNKGQLGNGSKENSSFPVQVIGLTDIISIAGGSANCMVVKKDGTVWAWGANENGQLGNGTTADAFIPIQVDKLINIVSVACGSTHSMALQKDGTLWTWGSNGNGQLGDGTTINKKFPAKLSNFKNIRLISSGDTCCIALKNNGTVWAWGGSSPLGNGKMSASTIPIRINNLNEIIGISSNYNHNMALKKDGTIWAWGNNWKGQIGDGTIMDKFTPVCLSFTPLDTRNMNNTKQNHVYATIEIKPAFKNKILNELPQDERFSEQWGLHNTGQHISEQECKVGIDINIIPAWKITIGSESTVIGILDTGVDINHEDLKDNVFINKNEILGNGIDDDCNGFIDDVNGWDFINNDNTAYDSSKSDVHGTAVSGIIAANNNIKGIIGISPKTKILPLKFMNIDNGCIFDVIKAIEYAQQTNVKLINCSWGWTDINYDLVLEDAIGDTDILFICSAGNKRSNSPPKLFYPACFNLPNILSVAAINSMGILDPSSNYGEGIHVAAPGVGILSTIPENKYMFFSGTSIATPYVSGIAALLKSYAPKLSYIDIAECIKSNVSYNKKLKDKVSSNGIVNAYNALKSIIKKEFD